jgi:hypothetical protein
VNLELYLLA